MAIVFFAEIDIKKEFREFVNAPVSGVLQLLHNSLGFAEGQVILTRQLCHFNQVPTQIIGTVLNLQLEILIEFRCLRSCNIASLRKPVDLFRFFIGQAVERTNFQNMFDFRKLLGSNAADGVLFLFRNQCIVLHWLPGLGGGNPVKGQWGMLTQYRFGNL